MSIETIKMLARKFFLGTASKQEKESLHQWYDANNAGGSEIVRSQSAESKEEVGKRLYKEIRKEIRREKNSNNTDTSIFRLIFKWKTVAIVLLILSTGLYFYNRPEPQILVKKTVKPQPEIKPGGNKAILTLADGTKIVLDDAGKGVLAKQSGNTITKTSDGQLIYKFSGTSSGSSTVEYNTIETPKGGQYQIHLPDGSKVWLNAGSSLNFPTTFRGAERNVTLTGEAYFEVEKNPGMPFKVHSQNQTVEVLGTHFNVNSYSDEPVVKTTLIEGRVRVSDDGTNQSKLLRPGQELNHEKNGDMQVKDAHTEQAIAWKEGKFVFTGNDIKSIMRQIERWYDVEVTYDGNMTGKDFVGSVSRFENVSEVLRKLELTGTIHFEIEGRRITVMP